MKRDKLMTMAINDIDETHLLFSASPPLIRRKLPLVPPSVVDEPQMKKKRG